MTSPLYVILVSRLIQSVNDHGPGGLFYVHREPDLFVGC